jgi:erythromycin esterase-like protein
VRFPTLASLVALVPALLACGSSAPPAAPAAPVAAPSCGAPIRGLETLRDAELLLVGEMHGTEESPAFLARLLCERGAAPTVLGLEMPASEQPALDAFLASDGGALAIRALVAGAHWQMADQDGRSSLAMLALVETARRARQQGRALDVVAFDIEPPGGADRDARMAKNLLAARAAHPGAALIVLTGNIHASTVKGTPWDPDLVPMGAHLRSADAPVRSVDVRYAGGTAWVCMMDGGCGAAELTGRDRGPAPFVEAITDRPGFDAIYYVGALTASPPAIGK